MKSLLINVEKPEVREIEINNYTDFYPAINCSCFDVAGRFIGKDKKYFDIFVDDIGMLKDDCIVSAIDIDGDCALVGNLVVTKTGADGNQIDLTTDEIDYLKKYIRTGYRIVGTELIAYPVLVDISYFKE